MLVSISDDFENKEEVIEHLKITESLIKIDPGIWSIDISKFLRMDLSLNLELLEIAVEFVVENMEKTSNIYVTGINEYFILRGIRRKKNSMDEERKFIMSFISSVANEFSDSGNIKTRVLMVDVHNGPL